MNPWTVPCAIWNEMYSCRRVLEEHMLIGTQPTHINYFALFPSHLKRYHWVQTTPIKNSCYKWVKTFTDYWQTMWKVWQLHTFLDKTRCKVTFKDVRLSLYFIQVEAKCLKNIALNVTFSHAIRLSGYCEPEWITFDTSCCFLCLNHIFSEQNKIMSPTALTLGKNQFIFSIVVCERHLTEIFALS